MPLDSLRLLVELLKERIQGHGAALRGSEALTRYALIDPLLRELGWDTADPSLVVPEYKSGNGRADYALLGSDEIPAMMVEAKSLGSSLRDSALTQGIQYCLEKGTKHFALTDGNCWEIYETHRPVPMEEKRVVTFDVSAQPAAEVCLQALALWRPSLETGRTVAGHAPIVEHALAQQPTPALETTSSQLASEPAASQSTTDVPGEKKWQPLSELDPTGNTPSPSEIRFPDNSRDSTKYWSSVVVEVARWLVMNEHLNPIHCPIQRKSRYLVATSPVHPDGKKFTAPHHISNVYIEKNYNARNLVINARTIIEHVGQDPAQFKVQFD